MIPTLAVFAVSYALIAFRRVEALPVGRTGGAWLGAVGMVAVGALTPAQSYAAIDHDTLALLLGMMALDGFLDEAGVFTRLSDALLARCRTGLGVLTALATLSAALSALLVNDAVCVFLTPVAVAICRRAKLPFAPFLLAIATSSNIGSAATAVGNPQNMILARMGAVPFTRFLALAGPAAAAAFVVNLALLLLYFGRDLRGPLPALAPEPPAARARASPVLLTLVGVVAGFLLNFHMGYTALAGAAVLFAWARRDAGALLQKLDLGLLVFFAGLFVVVAGLDRTGLPARAFAACAPAFDLATAPGIAAFTAAMALGANVVSNVPLALLAGPHVPALVDGALGWVLLAYILTIAGNLTLVGSVANLIVAEGARRDYALGFWEYLRFGAASTTASLLVGVPVLWLTATW